MKHFSPIAAAVISLAVFQACEQQGSVSLTYPETRTDAVADDYHGTMVADPYRWLENMESDETSAWLNAQKEVENAYFADAPGRDAIRERLRKNWDFPKFHVPKRNRGYYWFFYNDGLKEYPSLMRKRGIDTENELLVDPMELSEDSSASVTAFYPSEYSDYVAYTVNIEGSDWEEIEILDTRSMEPTEEILEWVKFTTIAWTGTGNGFYYCSYEAPPEGEEYTFVNRDQKIFYHKVGTDQSKDSEVQVPGARPDWIYDLKTTSDGRYLIIQIYEGAGTTNRVYYRDIVQQSKVIQLIDANDATYDFIDSEGPVFYFRTTKDAPRGRVVAINIGDPRSSNVREVIAESEHTLDKAVMARGQYGNVFVAHYLASARSRLAVFNKDGEADHDIELPVMGSVSDLTGYRRESNVFFAFESFAWPRTIFLYDAQTKKLHEHQKPITSFNAADYAVDQQFAESADGAKVPVFIVKKGSTAGGGGAKAKLKKGGAGGPTLLYGYGGFGVNLSPSFSPATLTWLEMGGTYALVNARGGGEMGEDWHKAGMRDKKQNVFNDVIAAAELLVKRGVSSPSKLALQGGSNGGLMVGAVINQRPDLFRAAVPQVGVMDMLRYHQFTIGWAWADEYGRSDDADAFAWLFKYSPLHNVKDGTAYPATLVMTSAGDDRVVPAHSYKYAARLQKATTGGPVVLRVEGRTGHGSGTPVSKQIDAQADRLTFLARELGLK